MDSRKLSADIVLYYPSIGRYLVFFKEGGVQNFDVDIDYLPHSVRRYVRECEESNCVEEFTTSMAPVLAHPEQALIIRVYSKAYKNNK